MGQLGRDVFEVGSFDTMTSEIMGRARSDLKVSSRTINASQLVVPACLLLGVVKGVRKAGSREPESEQKAVNLISLSEGSLCILGCGDAIYA